MTFPSPVELLHVYLLLREARWNTPPERMREGYTLVLHPRAYHAVMKADHLRYVYDPMRNTLFGYRFEVWSRVEAVALIETTSLEPWAGYPADWTAPR